MDASQVKALFAACDLDGSGYIDRQELGAICSHFDAEEINGIFEELDGDGDGRISVAEFTSGFEGLLARQSQRHRKTSVLVAETDRCVIKTSKDRPQLELSESLDDGLHSLSCQEQVFELYQQLQQQAPGESLQQFENVLQSIIKDVKQQQSENQRLELSYKREKENHTRHLQQLEYEMENQVQKVEARIRDEEKKRTELEVAAMKEQMAQELMELTGNLHKLQQVNQSINKEDEHEMKQQVDSIKNDNRHLRGALTEAQTTLALLKSELSLTREKYAEKCHEHTADKDTLLELVREQDNLARQVHLLHNANQKLYDTNDDLRNAVDTPRRNVAAAARSISTPHDLHTPYSTSSPGSHRRQVSIASSLADELSMEAEARRSILPVHDRCEVDSLPDDFDSGHSTLRDVQELDSEYEPNSIDEDMLFPPQQRRNRRPRDGDYESELPESLDELEDDDSCRAGSPCGSRTSSRASSQGSARRMARRRTFLQKVITAEPERMYKLVLAGDAAVGKSSFIMRLCKDTFTNNISSTLGVDFQNKVIEVDGHIVALQLWDTAGQERFRSIAKSYFRRADGVLLLYDCTYERSFLSVRDWVEAIEDGAQKKIPIMICANKIDMRDSSRDEGKQVIEREDGERLARDFQALFTETSAKDGDKVLDSVTELARLLRTYEDLEVQTVGMKLQEMDSVKKKINCCN